MSDEIDKLDVIEFHDSPIENLQFGFEPSMSMSFTLFQYDDKMALYRWYSLLFKEILFLDLPKITLDQGQSVDASINDFTYSFEDKFTCELELLFGSGQPSWNLVFDCKSIDVVELEPTAG